MKIINNTTEKLADDLRVTIKKRSRVSMAAACFSVYAFEELKAQLENLDELRFIFTSPAFLDEKPKKAQREFYIPRLNRERTLHGSEFEIKLRSEFRQRAISQECAHWIREKARFKSNKTIPYVFFVYLFDKVGQAVRLAPGADISEKILNITQGFSEAFSNALPSVHPLDLLIGIVGAVVIRLIVYVKGKNAKKYRKGAEYGSARWGNAEDIKPYIDPDFQNNIILTQTERLTMNSRPKQPKYARNKNVVVIGGSGSGKTRFFVKPNLMQLHSSYVLTDPKGTVLIECGKLLQRAGYRIKVLNTINFRKSMHYNPFVYIRSEKDVLKVVNTLIVNTKGEGEKSAEDFWVKAERLLYCALIGYIWYEAPAEEMNFTTLLELINASEAREDDEEYQSPVDLLFADLEERSPDHFAVKQYKKYKLAAGKTAKSILISCGARLAPFDIEELRELMSYDELELDTLGDRKTALFLIMSDTDDTFNFVIAILQSQLFNLLCDKADDEYNGKLPVHVRFLLDEFANIGQIPRFDKLIATMLADFMEAENGIVVNLHIQSIDHNEAIKTIKRKITDLDRMKIEEQKKAIRSGYDMDIIPSDLATYGGEAKNLLRDLQSRNERMFLLTLLVLNMADTKQKLDNDVFSAASIAQKYNCMLTRLDYRQEQGLMSSIPLGENLIQIQRGLTTSSTAIFVPFTVQELFQSGEALYYGLNALSNNMILCDRKRLKNPNGLILGTPGSGKSFSAKREITNAFLITADDIIICDPEAEYYPLVERLKGQVIKVSQNSTQYINPMDINLNYSEGDTPIALKSDFILSFCELIMGGKNGLEAVEKTLIDRAVISVYRSYLADPKPENMPILGDLYNEIKKQPEKEAQRIASALELYVNGSLNVFNHRTNVDIHNRLVCFDIKELGTQLRKLGMLIVQDQVWNRVTINRSEGKATRYYIDEFHLLLKEEQTAAYSVEIWKRFRKWGGIPTGITQNVKDLLSSREVENIFENSDFVYMLNQAQGDREILAKQLNISQQQMTYVTHSDAGEGLIFYGNVILPFIDRFPQDTELYRVMTTKPGEVSA